MEQAIAWANVDPDLYRQTTSLGLNELNDVRLSYWACLLIVWNKPFTEPTLIQIYIAIWRHSVSMS